MLLFVIFLYSFSVASANNEILNSFLNEIALLSGDETTSARIERSSTKKKNDFEIVTATCDQMSRTSLTPFVCLLLLKTSGRFLGMGSIIDRDTVLTAAKVVENSLQSPNDLLALAGRLGPWWGKNSQVKPASDIYTNDAELALVKLKESFLFDKNVSPIRLPVKVEKEFAKAYGKTCAVFGIPRSSWDMPGDYAPKSCTYNMKVESQLEKKDEVDACKAAFPGSEFNDTINFCTTANGTYCWGCIGSPTVAVTEKNKVLQVATVTKTTTSDKDTYHVHTKIAPFDQWIRSQSNINYKDKETF